MPDKPLSQEHSVIRHPLDKLPDFHLNSLDKNLCVCNEVSKRLVIDAIANGARTVEAVRRITYASDGNGCCERQIERLITYLWGDESQPSGTLGEKDSHNA